MNTQRPFFIISAESESLADGVNADRMRTLKAQLHYTGLPVIEVNGQYDGIAEHSLLVVDNMPSSPHASDVIQRFGRLYGQETVLSVDSNRACSLVSTEDGARTPLGQFINVPEHEARTHTAYTERALRLQCRGKRWRDF